MLLCEEPSSSLLVLQKIQLSFLLAALQDACAVTSLEGLVLLAVWVAAWSRKAELLLSAEGWA